MLICHGLLPRHLVVTRRAYRRMTSVMPESVQRESMSPSRLAIGVPFATNPYALETRILRGGGARIARLSRPPRISLLPASSLLVDWCPFHIRRSRTRRHAPCSGHAQPTRMESPG